MFIHIWNPSPTIFTIGSFSLQWYGLLLALAALAGLFLLRHLGRTHEFSENLLVDLFIWLTVAGFLGGRVYHVLNEYPYYLHHPSQIWRVWEGGLGIHGAILAGLGTLILFAKHYRIDVWKLLDITTPALALGQAIGRWGNYANQELFGRPTNLPWGIPIEVSHRPKPYLLFSHFHPTFLYESLGNGLIVLVLIQLGKQRRLPAGTVALTYFSLYALLRALTETIRIDQTPIIAGIRLPILVSGVMILTATILLVRRFHHGPTTPQTTSR